MDPNAPLTVTTGTAITCESVCFTSPPQRAYGTFKRLPIGPLAASAAVNGGIVGATFFSFREYIVTPQLVLGVRSGQYARKKAELDAVKSGSVYIAEKLDWWEMRAQQIPDTAVSGALTGGVLNAWKRGRGGIVPGAVTASILCTFLQVAYNELGIMRLKFIQEQVQKSRAEEIAAATVAAELHVAHQAPLVVAPPSKPVSERIFGWFGFQRVTDEDYLLRLKTERETYLKRIAELERDQAEGSSGLD
ncbi:hypothetical protein EUX98_g3832 [Antrodiella citrinella]|uniref:Uncharacterized protein n=1 Tax=Antrodiella citrinella TaxID=2447956 RepID=A0A4S4N3N9_9APHY|nr:hypothetical protein EUX98_g3832 [Antrodiella citrinella]